MHHTPGLALQGPAEIWKDHLPPSAPTRMEQHLEAVQDQPSQMELNSFRAPLLLPFPLSVVSVAVGIEVTLS